MPDTPADDGASPDKLGSKRLSDLEDTVLTHGHNGSNQFVVQYKKQTSKAHATHSM